MPRVALIVQDFINNGTFLTSQYFMNESVWLNVPWGPFLIWFYAFFIIINPDPIVVADLLTLFNYVSILSLTYLGWKYFSPTVGVLSGLLLATNPYWVSYSRIIYQPAPVVSFITLSMLLLFSVIRDKSRLSSFLIPISWVILFQIYIPTYAFIIISFLFLLFNIKTLKLKYFIFGILAAFILVIPTIKFYMEKPMYVERFITAPTRFTAPEKNIVERFVKVSNSFANIPMGGYFKWQTGYSYQDFLEYFKTASAVSVLIPFLFLATIIFFVKKTIYPKLNQFRLLVFLWSIAAFISLNVLWVTDLLPRYFLISIPPIMLMIAIAINDLLIKYKNKIAIYWLLFMIPVLLSVYWAVFSFKYDNFVKDYDYPNGRFYDIAETPYLHFKEAMDWADNNSLMVGCGEYMLTNDYKDLSYGFWMETEYVWKYLYKYELSDENSIPDRCKYLLTYEYTAKELNVAGYQKFGPFVVYRYLEADPAKFVNP